MANYIATAPATYGFPDFSQQCPLCGGKKCAVRIGFYYRKKLVFQFKTYKNVPMARWLCQEKGSLKVKHRTFSLLPSALIPYHRHDLNLVAETVKYKQQAGTSYEQTKSYIIDHAQQPDIDLENKQIKQFQQLITIAFTKLMAIPEIKQRISRDCHSSDPIATVLRFADRYQSPFLTTSQLEGSNIEQLAWDFFYNFQRGCYFDRQFLFGTPSQKRQ
jgi:hypothetical protein